jgi:hypothetical protein
MMVMSRDTCLANTAMLTTCGLEKIAGRAKMSRMKEDAVIWVPFHLFCVVLWSDE